MCSHAKDDRYPSGGTFVAIHDIRAAVGTDKVSDAEVFSVDAGCTPGTRLDKGSASSATTSNGTDVSVTITRFDADLIEGTVSAKFEDLSTFEGSFSIPPCAGSAGFGQSPTCE